MSELDPWWITGFVDGEGCFYVSFSVRESRKPSLEVRPGFSVSQTGKRNCPVLEKIQKRFGCGAIRYSANDGTYKYEVRSLDDLLTYILPFFQKYPFQTPKGQDFQNFIEVCSLMKRNLHKNREGLITILDLSYAMNPCGKRKYTKEYLLKLIRS